MARADIFKEQNMKKYNKKMTVVMTTILAAMLLAGCGSETKNAADTGAAASETNTQADVETGSMAQDTENGESVELTILAAASLTDVCNEIKTEYEAAHPNVTLNFSYGASGALQTQIEEGAPVDVFFSASMKQMNALQDEKMIDTDSVVKLLENKLVMIVPAGSTLELKEFSDVLNANTIAIGDPESVPAGQYAKEAFTNLGIWDALQEKTLSLGTNVTEVLEWVAAGSADVGFVYKTDAMSKAGQVDIVAGAPEGSLENPVIYPVGQLTNAANPEGAAAFLEFLQTNEALAVFEEYGFTPNV